MPAANANSGWSTGEKWGAGLLGGGALAALMGNAGAPYKDAQNTLNDFYNRGMGYLTPYSNAGTAEINPLNDAASSLMNPTQLQNEWSQSYQTSPEEKAIEQQATNQGLNDASSMGLLGSSPALQAIQAGTSNIGLQDRQNYMQQLMQKYLSGVDIRQNMFNQGNMASGNIANLTSNVGNTMANLKYGQEEAGPSLFGSLLGGAAGFFAGGGAPGAMLGAKLGGGL